MLILADFTSCSPAYRLNHLLKKHPELTKSDTTTKVIPVVAPSIIDSVVFAASSKAMDSILDKEGGKPVYIPNLLSGDTSKVIDTVVTTEKKTQLHIVKKHNQVSVQIVTPPQVIDKVIPVAVISTKPVIIQKASFWDYIHWWGILLPILIAIVLILGIIRAFRK